MGRKLTLMVLGLMLFIAQPESANPDKQPVVVLNVDGVINTFSTQYLERGLRVAEQQGAQLAVVILDTPGGIETAMRDIVQMLLNAPLASVVYVYPGGARATSAGMFILLSADLAAMAPATHVGAAHPVPLGADPSDVMDAKMTQDAAALARSIAEKRGKNGEWAERAVKENLAITASEALDLGVIDLIAEDLDDLLEQLDGRQVGGLTLRTVGAMVQNHPMTLNEKFFHLITEPNIAYLLLSLGTLLLLVEISNPGLSVAGAGAGVAYIIAFMAFGSLPVNWAGLFLLAISLVFFLVGLLTDTEFVVSVVGLVPFVLGSLLLFSPFSITSPAAPDVHVNPWLIAFMALSILAFSFFVLRAILFAMRRPPRSSAQRLIGHQGVALSDLTPTGQVRVDLEDWSAVSMAGDIACGAPVRVSGVSGVHLQVLPDDKFEVHHSPQ